MRRLKRNLKSPTVLLALSLVLPRPDGVRAEQSEPRSGSRLLNTRVTEFEMHDETVLDGLWNLARGPSPFGFGFERVLKRRLTDSDIPDPRFSLELKGKTIREVLNALCEADHRFTWSMDGATVNVFPRAISNDASYLLNRKLERFELKNATDVQNGLLAIVNQLPPPVEHVAEAQIGGADPYPPEPWTVTFQNLTVRQVVNRLAAHGGRCGTWIFGGSMDFRTFGFFNTHLPSKRPPPWVFKGIESRPKSPQR